MLIRRIRFPVAVRHRLFHKALHSSRPFRDHCADRPRSAPASAAFRHVDLQESDHKATAESGVLLGSRPSNRVSSTDCAKPGTASLFAANVASVHPELTRLLAKRNDVLLRADFRPGAHSILDRAVARGELTRLFPRTYVRTTRLTEPWVRWAAALRYAGNCAALSFVTGLQFWRLMPPSPGAVHITIGGDRQLRGGRGLVVHRRTGFRPEPPLALRRDGLVAAVLERCVVESWPVLPATLRREPVICAIQSRRTTPARLRAEAATLPRLPGRRALLDLVGVLDVGCASELEIWGHLHVFTGPDFAHLRRQLAVHIGRRTVYLDLADEATMVAIELDGAAYHDDTLARERDRRRDALLATLGWLTLRFSSRRLRREPDAARREALQTMAVRRAQLGRGS